MNARYSLVTFAIMSLVSTATVLAQNYGDCTATKYESNASCMNARDCGQTSTCFSASLSCPNNACGSVGCNFAVSIAQRKYGTCTDTYWDYGCTECGAFWCMQSTAYQTKDSNNQCQNGKCNIILAQFKVCVAS